MAAVERFEDLRVWQGARQICSLIYAVSSSGNFSQDFALKDQIRRAVVSMMSNIAEGFHAGSDAEFRRFLGYARRSLAEVQSQLYIALDQGYLPQDEFDDIFSHMETTFRQINALIGYLCSSTSKRISEQTAIYDDQAVDRIASIEINPTIETDPTIKTNPTIQTTSPIETNLTAEATLTNKQPNSRFCFVCGLENPYGLGLHFYETAPGEVTVETIVPPHFQGYPGVVHGGIVASLVDEVLGRAHMGTDPEKARFLYTAKLTVEYHQNVPVGEPIRIVGHAGVSKRRAARSTAEITNMDGEVLVKAEALLVNVPKEKLESVDMEALGWKIYPDA